MANDTTSKVLELVVFTLRDGASRGEFLATGASMDAWLREQPGFMSNDLLFGDDGASGGSVEVCEAIDM